MMSDPGTAKPRSDKVGGRAATTGVIPGRYALSVGNPSLPGPAGWKWTLLTDVARLETGHTPSRRKPEYWAGSIPWIGIRDAGEHHGREIYDTEQHVSQLGLDNSAARLLPVGTVCVSRTASIGYVTRMGVPMATSQDFVNWIGGPSLNSEYLFYVMLAEVESLQRFGYGTTHKTIYFPEVKAFHVLLPPPSEQDAIVRTLAALDDKIDQNRQTSETLERLMRAIFQAWFVDFEPVKAKAAGAASFPSMPQDVFDALPTQFVDSPVGPTPQGWEAFPLGTFIELQRGKTYKSKLKDLPGPVLLGLGSIERNGGFRAGNLSTYGGDSPASMLLVPGDLYVSLKDVTQSADLLGAVARVPPHVPLGRVTQDTVKLNFAADAPSRELVYRYLLTPNYRGYCRAHSTGTTNLGLGRDDFLRYPIVRPSAPIERLFDSVASSTGKLMAALSAESSKLAELRDYLLPKLLSGKVRVRDAERIAESA